MKWLAIQPRSLLAKKHGRAQFLPHQQRRDGDNGAEDDEGRNGDDEIEDAFDSALSCVHRCSRVFYRACKGCLSNKWQNILRGDGQRAGIGVGFDEGA